MTDHNDAIASLNRFGMSPGYETGFTHLGTDPATTPDGVSRAGAIGHSQYPTLGDNGQLRTSGYNIATVVAGMSSDQLVLGQPGWEKMMTDTVFKPDNIVNYIHFGALMIRRRAVVYVAVSIFATLPFTGCGVTDDNNNAGSTASPAAIARLQSLPSLDATESAMKAVVIQLGAYISSLVPGMQWSWHYDRSVTGCTSPYNHAGGTDVFLQDYGGSESIPEDVWPKVLGRARELAAPFGATNVETFQDKPGNHDVRFYSHENTALQVTTMANAVISGNTGCRLPSGHVGS